MTYSKELEVAREAAYEAAAVMKRFVDEGFNIELKGKNDLVTEADLASEKIIIETIQKYFPEDVFLSEEGNSNHSLTDQRTWIIDPIDGTTNFAHKFPVFCASIALWENKEAKVGLVYQVATNEMFTAIKGEGAFLNEQPIKVSGISNLSESLLGTGFPYKNFELLDNYLDLFKTLLGKCQGVRRPGAASYDLCCVAAGRFDGFYEHGLSPWDVAAGSLIIQEAGGLVTDWLGGENWMFGQRFIAGNSSIHKQLMAEIHQQFETEQLS